MILDLGSDAESGFSRSIAAQLARLSELAYEAPHAVRRSARDMGIRLAQSLSRGGTQVFVFATDLDVVVAFRGTEITSIDDVRTDLRFGKVRGPLGGSVHAGFAEALDMVRHELEEALLPLGCSEARPVRLWLTGHSLGGALAHLCAAALPWSLLRLVRGVYTFGQPRVGNWTHAWRHRKALDGLAYRLVMTGDPVTVLPPLLWGFVHSTSATYIDADGEIRRGPGLLSRLHSIIRARRRDPLRFAHAAAGYRRALLRAEQGDHHELG